MYQIEMIMQKYGDKIQIGYKALRDQYSTYNILDAIIIFSVFGFLFSTILLTVYNVNDGNFDKDYFDKEWSSYKHYRFERMLVYLNFILPILCVIIGITAYILIGVLSPDYGFIKSLMGG